MKKDTAQDRTRTRVVVVGGGFVGLNIANQLGSRLRVDLTVIDRRNHHLFQPLLYQVAMAGLSPAEIAAPIRSLLSHHRNISVVKDVINSVDIEQRAVKGAYGTYPYDYLVLAPGAKTSFFGRDEWQHFAPGLKTIADATEIRRRVLGAFERAETASDAETKRALLTFVVVGGGPTGVELAGALGEMSRLTLARDFRNIDPKLTRVILVDGGTRVLKTFHEALSAKALRDLERLGVHVWTNTRVTDVGDGYICLGDEVLRAATILWAAGVQASELNHTLGVELDRGGRVVVEPDLSIPGHPDIFVAGDASHCKGPDGKAPLPGVASVAIQQGKYLGKLIRREMRGRERKPFRYRDKGQMATIGRSRAVVQAGSARVTGLVAWLAWLLVHIYYLSSFRNRLLVLIHWAYSYLTVSRGARLIVDKIEHRVPQAKQQATTPEPDTPTDDSTGQDSKPESQDDKP